jgi:hypothetical protein
LTSQKLVCGSVLGTSSILATGAPATDMSSRYSPWQYSSTAQVQYRSTRQYSRQSGLCYRTARCSTDGNMQHSMRHHRGTNTFTSSNIQPTTQQYTDDMGRRLPGCLWAYPDCCCCHQLVVGCTPHGCLDYAIGGPLLHIAVAQAMLHTQQHTRSSRHRAADTRQHTTQA